MKTGVWTTPWFSVSVPRRAAPSVLRSSNCSGLFQKRLVAIAEAAVALGDRVGVGGTDVVVAGESRNQHEQRRFRQVEVGDQAVDNLEAVAGGDENVGLGCAGGDGAIVGCRRFEGAQAGRA